MSTHYRTIIYAQGEEKRYSLIWVIYLDMSDPKGYHGFWRFGLRKGNRFFPSEDHLHL